MFGKKKKEVIDDSFDFDSELDFDDFNFDMSPPEDDRKPTAKVASGFLEGLTTGLKDTAFIRQTVKDIFPRGFGETIDLYDKIEGSAKKLYDDSAAQIKPAVQDFKRVSAKLIPGDSKLLPESVKNLLKSWKEETDERIIGKADQKEAFLQSQLADIFKAQTEADVKSKVEENARDDLKLGIDIKQHKDLFSLVNLIQSDVSRLSQYERTIGLSYQKKSLEIQYRQLFALQDLVTQGNQDFAMQKDALPKIVKNTSYPDYLKLTSTEFIKEINQRKFTEGIGKALFGRQAEFIEKMVSGIKDTVVRKVTDTVGDFRNSLLQIESQKDMMGDDVKIDKSTIAGYGAGGFAADGIGTLGGKWLRENVVDKSPRIKQAGEKLESFVENVPRSINEFKKSDSYEYETGPIAWLMRNLKDFIPKHGADLEFDRKFQREMHEPALFNKKTEKSITEIIPNYLARILREIQVFRTGNENIELTRFDYTKDKFTSDSKLKQQLLKTVVNQDSIKRNTREMDRMMEKIDPEKKLSKDASDQIRKRLLENSTSLNKANEKNLASSHKYRGDGGLEASSHMASYISQLSDKDKVEFERAHNHLMETIADPRGAMENMIKLGYGNDLRNIGLLDEKKRFLEKDNLMGMYLNPDKEVKSLTTTHKKRNKKTQQTLSKMSDIIEPKSTLPSNTSVTENIDLMPVVNGLKSMETKLIESIAGLKQININGSESRIDPSVQSNPIVNNLSLNETNDKIDETNRKLDSIAELLKNLDNSFKTELTTLTNNIGTKIKDIFNPESIKELFNQTNEKITKKLTEFSEKFDIEKLKETLKESSEKTLSKLSELTSGLKPENIKELFNQTNEKIAEALSSDKLKEVFSITSINQEKTNEILKSIEASLRQGAETVSEKTSGLKSKINDSSFISRLKNLFNKKEASDTEEPSEQVEDASVNEQGAETEPTFGKGLAGLVSKLAYKTTKGAEKLGKGLYGLSKRSFNAQIGILKAVGKNVKGSGIMDVYIEGEELPRMYGVKIVRGIYRKFKDKTIIRSHDDIDSAIEDSDGKIVIAEDELDKIYTKDSFGKIKKIIAKGFNFGKNLLNSIFNKGKELIPKLVTKQIDALRYTAGKVKSIAKGTWNLLDQPVDIYIPGIEDPVLLSVVMKAGGYFSKTTKQPIMRPGDIDGPVLDADGNEVLTLDMLRKGLYDAKGEKIKLPMQKIMATFGKALNGLWSIQKGAWNLTKKIGSKIMNFGRSLFEGFSLEINGKKTATLLDKIYTFMVDHWGKKSIIGDTDGDGEREGSWQQLKKKVKTKYAKPEKPTKEKPEKKNSLLDTLLGSISGLTSGISKLVTGALSIFGMGKAAAAAGTIASAAGTAAGGAAAAGATAKGAGLLAKIATLGKGALALLPGMGAASTAAAATTATTAAAASTAATAAAGTLGATAAGGATVAATGGVMATLGTIGAGIVSFLASPVVLGTLAVAGLAYGGYKLYNYLKTKLSEVDKVRLVQYGFHKDDQENYNRVFALEQYLKEYTHTDKDGMKIKEKDLEIKKLLSFFDLDHTNKQDLERFFRWYQNRFKPVYLTHCACMLGIKNTLDLNEVSKLKGNEVSEYLKIVAFPEGPYHARYLPIKDDKYVYQDAKAVKAVIDELQLKYKIDPTKRSKTLGAAEKLMKPAAIDKEDLEPPVQLNADALTDPNALQEKRKKKSNTLQQTSTVDLSKGNKDQKLVALLSVKYRAYGLTDLEKGKVNTLMLLEKEVLKNIKVTKDNVNWTGDPIDVMTKLKGHFGLTSFKDNVSWGKWFNHRFLPIFLDYATMFSTYAGSDRLEHADILKPSQQLDVAKLLAGHPSAWSVKETPFPGYLINTDPSTVKENIEFLESIVKEEKLAEQKKPADQTTTGVERSIAKNDTGTNNKETGALAGKTQTEKPAAQTTTGSSSNIGESNAAVTGNLEGEEKPTGGISASAKPIDAKVNPNGLRLASGPLKDGRNGFDAIRLAKDVKLENMNPALMKQFYGMVEEYKQITGKDLVVTDAWRSYEDQVKAKQKYGARAATPGKSLHEFGLGLDADSKTLDEIDNLGLMRKYGLTRPVGQEPWHVEPIGIQFDIDRYRKDPGSAIQAIEEGIGRGGGGFGTVKDALKYRRNRDLSVAIAKAQIEPNVTLEKMEKTDSIPSLAKNESSASTFNDSALPSNGGVMKTSMNEIKEGNKPSPDRSSGMSALNAPGGRNSQMQRLSENTFNPDAEKKPSSDSSTGIVKAKLDTAANKDNVKLEETGNKLPADPSVKVAAPVNNDIQSVKQTVVDAAKLVGVDPDIAVSTVAVESGFKPHAQAKTSSAKGLYQFINSTWKETVLKHGSKHGMDLNNADPLNAKDNAIMGAHFIKDIGTTLNKKTGQDVGPTETYLGHFLGPGGGSSFLRNMEKNPNAPAAEVMPKAANANKPIFYNGNQPKSFTQIYQELDKKVKTRAGSFGITLEGSNFGLKPPKEGLYQDRSGNVSNPVAESTSADIPKSKSNVVNVSDATSTQNTTQTPVSKTSTVADKIVPVVPTVSAVKVPGKETSTSTSTTTDVTSTLIPTRNDNVRVKKLTLEPESYAESVGIKTDKEKDKIKQMTDIGRNPISDAYGFNNKQISQANKDNNPLLNLSLMKETEGLLGKSVSIQSEMLTVMKDIYGIILKKNDKDVSKPNNASKPAGTTASGSFTPPSLPVSMKKTA